MHNNIIYSRKHNNNVLFSDVGIVINIVTARISIIILLFKSEVIEQRPWPTSSANACSARVCMYFDAIQIVSTAKFLMACYV